MTLKMEKFQSHKVVIAESKVYFLKIWSSCYIVVSSYLQEYITNHPMYSWGYRQQQMLDIW